jgi:hypothetical protein
MLGAGRRASSTAWELASAPVADDLEGEGTCPVCTGMGRGRDLCWEHTSNVAYPARYVIYEDSEPVDDLPYMYWTDLNAWRIASRFLNHNADATCVVIYYSGRCGYLKRRCWLRAWRVTRTDQPEQCRGPYLRWRQRAPRLSE